MNGPHNVTGGTCTWCGAATPPGGFANPCPANVLYAIHCHSSTDRPNTNTDIPTHTAPPPPLPTVADYVSNVWPFGANGIGANFLDPFANAITLSASSMIQTHCDAVAEAPVLAASGQFKIGNPSHSWLFLYVDNFWGNRSKFGVSEKNMTLRDAAIMDIICYIAGNNLKWIADEKHLHSIAASRPDFVACPPLRPPLVMLEEKVTGAGNLAAAIFDLERKFMMLENYSGRINQIVGIAIAGDDFSFGELTARAGTGPNGELSTYTQRLLIQLPAFAAGNDFMTGTLQILTAAVNIGRWCRFVLSTPAVTPLTGQVNYNEIVPRGAGNGTIAIYTSHVEKTYTGLTAVDKRKIVAFYKKIQHTSVAHSAHAYNHYIELAELKEVDGDLVLKLRPTGLANTMPTNANETKMALYCLLTAADWASQCDYTIIDFRWLNVIRSGSNANGWARFYLIDAAEFAIRVPSSGLLPPASLPTVLGTNLPVWATDIVTGNAIVNQALDLFMIWQMFNTPTLTRLINMDANGAAFLALFANLNGGSTANTFLAHAYFTTTGIPA